MLEWLKVNILHHKVNVKKTCNKTYFMEACAIVSSPACTDWMAVVRYFFVLPRSSTTQACSFVAWLQTFRQKLVSMEIEAYLFQWPVTKKLAPSKRTPPVLFFLNIGTPSPYILKYFDPLELTRLKYMDPSTHLWTPGPYILKYLDSPELRFHSYAEIYEPLETF